MLKPAALTGVHRGGRVNQSRKQRAFERQRGTERASGRQNSALSSRVHFSISDSSAALQDQSRSRRNTLDVPGTPSSFCFWGGRGDTNAVYRKETEADGEETPGAGRLCSGKQTNKQQQQ